jgi:hypothetical protein
METVAAAVHLYVVHVLALGFNDPSGATRYLHGTSWSASQLTPLQRRMIQQDLDPLAGSHAASANRDDETRPRKAVAAERDAATPTDAASGGSGGSGAEAPGAKITAAACSRQGEAAAATEKATEKATETASPSVGDASVSTPWYRRAAASLAAMVGASSNEQEGEPSRDLSLTPQQLSQVPRYMPPPSPLKREDAPSPHDSPQAGHCRQSRSHGRDGFPNGLDSPLLGRNASSAARSFHTVAHSAPSAGRQN